MKFARRVFMTASIYGFIVLLPQYFLEAKLGRDQPPPVTHPEFFYGFTGVGLAFQWLFWIIARDPVRYRAAMLPSIAEKITFGGAVLALFALGRVAPPMVGAAAIDLLLAALFVAAWLKTPRAAGS